MPIKKLSRILSSFSLFFSVWTVIKSPPGLVGGALWLPKLWAGAWAPFLALLGSLGAILGGLSKDTYAVFTGLMGTILGVRHTVIVSRPQADFTQAFGEDWQDRIPSGLKARMCSKRYRLIQPAPPIITGRWDVNLGASSHTGEPLLCDLWEPPQGIPRTGLGLVYLHGGLWQALDKDFLTQPIFRRLAGQGHVIMDLAYSLAPGADLTRMLGDVKQAIVWMKSHAQEYQINPDRVVLMGVSGGAHLALLAAYAPDHLTFQQGCPQADMTIRAVISMFGITDLAAFFHEYGQANRQQPETSSQIADHLRPQVRDKTWFDRMLTRSRAFPAYRHANMPGGALLLVYLLGGTLKEIPEVYHAASPIVHVGPHCPPTLQIYAENDFVIDASHGRSLHHALRQAGVPSVYLEFPESVHAFDQYIGVVRRIAPAAQSATYDLERFLALMI
jgi:acetyl esterase/lipase